MPTYQIEFNLGGSSKSFKYFTVLDEKSIESYAEIVANDWLKNRMTTYKPPKTLMVREYDEEKKTPKRGGQRRKLRLSFLQLTTDSGRKERQEWYEYKD